MEDELRIWIAVRTDLDLPPGKMAAQAAHAAASLVWMAACEPHRDAILAYMRGHQTKIVVRAPTATSLGRVHRECEAAGVPSIVITDAARTVLAAPTETVCGVGPCFARDLPKYVRRLQLL
jgi:peptidyl-tRNA hydrolase, PTH2 family